MSYYDLKVGSNFGLVDEVLKWDRSMLFKVVATFEYVDEILNCQHSNESCSTALSSGVAYSDLQVGSMFLVCGRNSWVCPSKGSFEQYLVALFVLGYFATKTILILVCLRSNLDAIANERVDTSINKPRISLTITPCLLVLITCVTNKKSQKIKFSPN